MRAITFYCIRILLLSLLLLLFSLLCFCCCYCCWEVISICHQYTLVITDVTVNCRSVSSLISELNTFWLVYPPPHFTAVARLFIYENIITKHTTWPCRSQCLTLLLSISFINRRWFILSPLLNCLYDLAFSRTMQEEHTQPRIAMARVCHLGIFPYLCWSI